MADLAAVVEMDILVVVKKVEKVVHMDMMVEKVNILLLDLNTKAAAVAAAVLLVNQVLVVV
jgi:hypothetical protein